MKGMNVEQENELWDIERRGMSYSLGLEHGLNQARDEGRRATLVEVILAVLEVRGIQLDADTRARIRSCESLATLQDWARRAREVARLQELFEPS